MPFKIQFPHSFARAFPSGTGKTHYVAAPTLFGKGQNYSANGKIAGKLPPELGEPPSDFGKSSPKFGKSPSDFGKRSPEFGKSALKFGELSSDFGKSASDFGKPPPKFGKPATEAGKPSSKLVEPGKWSGFKIFTPDYCILYSEF